MNGQNKNSRIKTGKISKNLFVLACLIGCLGLFWCLHGAYGALVPEAGKEYGYSDAEHPGSLDVFMILAVGVAQWILGIVGSLALLFFIYGGFVFLISGGSTTQIDKGKKILGGAVIGLIIVFASYLIIKFSLQTFGANPCMKNYSLNGYMCMEKSLGSQCKLNEGVLCPDYAATVKCCLR